MRPHTSWRRDDAQAPLRFVLALVNGAALALAAVEAVRLGESLALSVRRATAFGTLYAAVRDAASGVSPYFVSSTPPPTLEPALQPFVLPPAALLLFRPLALLDFGAARSAWTGLQLGALAVALGLLVHQTGLRWPRRFPAVFALLVLLFPPVRDALRGGDVEPVLLGLVTVSWALARRERKLRAGIFLGIAAALAPALLVLAVPWLVWARWRGFVVALAVALGLNVVAAAALGLDPSGLSPLGRSLAVGYAATLRALVPHWLAHADNAALPGLWLRLLTSGPGRVPWLDSAVLGVTLSLASIGGLVAILGWSAYSARARRDLVWSAAVVAALLVGPATGPAMLALTLFPVVALLRALPLRLGGTWDVLVAGLACLLGGPILLAQVTPPDRWLSGPALLLPALPALGLLLLGGLCVTLGQQPAGPFARRT